VLVVTGDDTLIWTPSPVAWPTFGLLPALALVPLLAPLVRRPVLPAAAPAADARIRPTKVAPA
jgi:hypothetical protein